MSLLYKSSRSIKASPSLLGLNEWQEKEKQSYNCAVDEEGCLLDNLTLELRVHPPEVHIDNAGELHSTLVTIDSANRPGSLVFVVEHFTELGLRINSARISSDGGWFHDMFLVSEAQSGKVRNPKKLQSIKQMLNVYMQDEDVIANGDDTDDTHRIETTVFELAGMDRVGLLADVMQLLTHNGCDVRSAAVWTYKGRVAFVFSVTEKGKPISDENKLRSLIHMVEEIFQGNSGGSFIVRASKVRGEVHHDRRLHQLMLQEERQEWERAHADLYSDDYVKVDSVSPASLYDGSAANRSLKFSGNLNAHSSPRDSVMSVHGMSEDAISPYRSPKFDRPTIEISHCNHPDYWTINISCRDRTKLLFDTVCTLADMDYDIYHATIDCGSDGWAHQEFFVRPRSGDGEFNSRSAALLQAMLDSSIQRRFPKGMKVHVRSTDRFGCLSALAHQLRLAGLSVTRAKARTFATSNSSGHTLYVMDAQGGPPDRSVVEQALMKCGGRFVEAADMRAASGELMVPIPSLHGSQFAFTFFEHANGQSSGRSASAISGATAAHGNGGHDVYGESPDSYYGSL